MWMSACARAEREGNMLRNCLCLSDEADGHGAACGLRSRVPFAAALVHVTWHRPRDALVATKPGCLGGCGG
jgi:hypothetical protein